MQESAVLGRSAERARRWFTVIQTLRGVPADANRSKARAYSKYLVMHTIRLAEEFHAEAIFSFDHITQYDYTRVAFIRRSIANRDCYVISDGGKTIGYAVLEYSFYQNGFISMLYVRQEYRRRGVGAELMQHLEGVCRTTKLFTSTNLSNTAMQSLLAKLGYVPSGVIENLDEGDPELIYFKCPKALGVA